MEGLSKIAEGYKTHILVLISIIIIASNMLTGQIELGTGVQEILIALGVSTLRAGVSGQMAFLKNYKTHIVVIAGLLVIAGRVLVGELDVGTAVQQGIALLGLSSFRIAIAKNQTK